MKQLVKKNAKEARVGDVILIGSREEIFIVTNSHAHGGAAFFVIGDNHVTPKKFYYHEVGEVSVIQNVYENTRNWLDWFKGKGDENGSR